MTHHSSFKIIKLAALIVAWTVGTNASAVPAASEKPVFPPWTPPGPNIALGASCTFPRPPDYKGTTDDLDASQLTDGVYVVEGKRLWDDLSAVGWNRAKPAGNIAIEIDLGRTRSIAGLSYSTEANARAEFGPPPAILVFVADDVDDASAGGGGKPAYRLAGELVVLSTKYGFPTGDGRHRYVTDEIRTRGRHVMLVVQTARFAVCDEIEIYEGPAVLLQSPPAGDVIADPRAHLTQNILPYAVPARAARDASMLRKRAADLDLDPAIWRRLLPLFEEARRAAASEAPPVGTDVSTYRALIPLNAGHGRAFALLGGAYRTAGQPELQAWPALRWSRQAPDVAPPKPGANTASSGISVRMMRNERRGATFNVLFCGAGSGNARVVVTGLPGGPNPAYLDVRQVEYITMQVQANWDADALPLAKRDASGWVGTVPPGLVRQFWLDFRLDRVDCPPGIYKGQVVVVLEGGKKTTLPLTFQVDAPRMANPPDRAVAVSCWDYSDMGGSGLIKASNLKAAVAHMRESGITAPWARSNFRPNGTFPRPGYDRDYDAEGKRITPYDFSAFDQWVAMWPDAKHYMIYAYAADPAAGFGDRGDGAGATPEAMKRVRDLMAAWSAHIRSKGIDPSRVVICLVDEPGWHSQTGISLRWMQPIREGAPEFRFFANPTYKPDYYNEPDVQEFLSQIDIMVPANWWSYHRFGAAARTFYENFRAAGASMGFFSCASGPATVPAVFYYRLQQWEAWKLNKGGSESWCGFWSYMDNRGTWPWAQLCGGGDVHFSPAYVDAVSATDGKHWLAIFEGAQDYEYMLMLKKRIEELRKAGRNDAAIAEAQAMLDALPDQVIKSVRSGNYEACDEARLRVLDALASLAK